MAFDEEKGDGNVEETLCDWFNKSITPKEQLFEEIRALKEDNASLRRRVKQLEDLLEQFDHTLRSQGLIDSSFPRPKRTIG